MKDKNGLWILIIFGFLFMLPNEASGNQLAPLVLDESTEKIDVYPAIEMMKDRYREWSAQDVSSEPLSEQFLPAEEIEQKSGFFETATWIRFQIENQSDQSDWLLEFAFPMIHEIQIYVMEDSGLTELHYGGADYPFGQRDIDHRYFVYDLVIEPNQTQTYYALAIGGGDLHPPINIWQSEAFIKQTGKESTLLGIFYGIVLVMIAYNLFLYISLRIKSYLYYVIAITFTLMGKLSINGIGFQYLWPNSPMWNKMATSVWVPLACIFILIFTRHFLESDQHAPAFKKWTYALISLNGSVPVILLASVYIDSITHYMAQYVMVLAALCTFLTVLVTGFICLKRGARQARFYIAGWLIFLTGVSITILERSVIFPYSALTEYAGQAALTAEVVLLSLALADKINMIRKEKDVAEKQAQESQALAIRNLQKADELKDEFLAVTSHELRTPLYGMIGIAESLQGGIAGNVSKEMKEMLSMVIKSGQRLTNLLNDILDLSKLKHDSLALHRKPVHVKGVVDLVCAVSMPLLKNKPIRLLNRLDTTLPLVWADEDRLQQILYNLIGNAIKYTDEGEIILTAQVNEDGLTICVSDTGRGIPKDQMHMIFQPFQQGDASLDRKASGIGIGLSIVKRLVDLHEGRLEVESKVGEGSSFRATLPIYHAQVAESEVAATMDEGSGEVLESIMIEQPEFLPLAAHVMENRPRVLVADDEPVNVQVLTNQLTLEGYEALAVFNGNDVLRVIEEEDIDLLILDIMMPDLSGYEVCQQLRKTYSLMELPVLMLTAKNQMQDKLAAFDAGANDYLVKPCDKQELLSRVRTLARVKTLNQELTSINLRLEEKVEERTRALEVANLDLNRVNEKLLAISASRRELLANIAHELGGPVTLVHGYVQSLQEGLIQSNDDHYQHLVLDKINVLSRLIDDLFDLSKLEAGQGSLNMKKIRLDTWVDQMYAHCEFAVSQGERHFQRGVLPTSFHDYDCYVDHERMDQVFTNVISNAVKHTTLESGKISVEATLTESDQLMIRVEDNGMGIREDELPHIFDRFYREQHASSKTTPSGTGLGLAIVKQIVQSHQGEVWAESTVNKGTSICFTLPVVARTEP